MQDFPYNFEQDVEHHNIWSTIPLDEKRVQDVSPKSTLPAYNGCPVNAGLLLFMKVPSLSSDRS